MEISLRTMTEEERNYSYRQSQQLAMQTGYIGSFTSDGNKNTWDCFRKDLNTAEFQEEMQAMANILSAYIVRDPQSYCDKRQDSEFTDHIGTAFGFRADTDKYAYLLRVDPQDSESPLKMFCHESKWLDRHIENAKQGIRFIDSNYKDLFRIKDGEKISLTIAYDGEKKEPVCRFIDPTYFEVGTGGRANLFHICQFAELMERNGNTYKAIPKEKMSVTKQLEQAKKQHLPNPMDKAKKAPDKEVR